MAQRGFGIFMAFAVLVLMVIMSTPVTSTGLHDAASKLLRRVSSETSASTVSSAG